jgi:hypothetical protein
LNGVYKRLPGLASLQATKFLGRNNNDLISPMHSYVLRPFTMHFAHEFAEASLGVLEEPGSPTHALLTAFGRLGTRALWICKPSHSDQNAKGSLRVQGKSMLAAQLEGIYIKELPYSRHPLEF